MYALKADGISFSYGKKEIFESLSFSIESNENLLIKGENGSGKTTLLKILAGILPVKKGNVIKDDINSIYVPSRDNGFISRLTGLENIKLINSLLTKPANIEDRIKNWIAIPTFKKAINTPFFQSSLGMKSILSLFVLTNRKSSIVLLDEPFKNFDENTKMNVTSLLKEDFNNSSFIFASNARDAIEYFPNTKIVELNKC